MSTQTSHSTVELYVRSLAPSGAVRAQNDRIRRLERLREQGRVGSVEVHVVGRGLVHEPCCLATDPGRRLERRMTTIKEWSVANDAVVPGIDTVTVPESAIGEQPYTVTTLPQNMLMEYAEGRVTCISPVTVEDTHFSVGDHLDSLAGTIEAPDDVRTRATSVAATTDVESVPEGETDADPDRAFASVTLGTDDNR